MIDWKELNRMFDCAHAKRPRRFEMQQKKRWLNPFGFTGQLHYKRKIGLENRLGAPKFTWEDIKLDRRMKRSYGKLGIDYLWLARLIKQ